jgi:hypothetical protein
MNTEKFEASKYRGKIQAMHNTAESLRKDSREPIDISFNDVVQSETSTDDFEGLTFDQLLEDLGIDPAIDTISAIQTSGDLDSRWLIPEIIRAAIRLGLRDAPIWPQITAMEVESTQKKMTMPFLNMSDAAPKRVNEGETIKMGAVSYGEKSVEVFKIGRGIKIPYEVVQFVSINVISLFLQDFGVKLGQALDTLAIDVLLNGDQADGSASAPVIGVTTPGTKVYKDYLRPWIRGSRMGRNFSVIIGGEDAALETLDLPEFKDKHSGTTQATLNMKTPVPNSADYFIHGNVPANQEILLDKRYALIKLNVIPLLIESDKVISNQTLETYASLTTGFAKMFLDSALILDESLDFAANGFPPYMDVDALQNVTL